jgi:outer membrane lipoprotein carrier protein
MAKDLLLAMLLLAATIASPGASHGQEATPPTGQGAVVPVKDLRKVVRELQQHYEKTRSFRAKFTEQITPAGAPTRTREGTVYFRKPGRMRWEFETPTTELVVSDGTTLYDYDPDLNQVVETPLKQALRAPGATEFLLGIGNIERDFDASPGKPIPDGLVHVVLTPKKGGNRLELGLDPKNYGIRALRIVDDLGNVTAIRFSGIDDLAALAESLFSFAPPAGADVVHPALPQ